MTRDANLVTFAPQVALCLVNSGKSQATDEPILAGLFRHAMGVAKRHSADFI
jgi:hypothetical protein